MSDKKMVNNDEDNEGTVNDIGEKNQLTRGWWDNVEWH
jgi:hypothetical protein